MKLADLKIFHTFSFMLDPSAKKTLTSLSESLFLDEEGAEHKAKPPKPMRVQEPQRSPEPSDQEILARLFV